VSEIRGDWAPGRIGRLLKMMGRLLHEAGALCESSMPASQAEPGTPHAAEPGTPHAAEPRTPRAAEPPKPDAPRAPEAPETAPPAVPEPESRAAQEPASAKGETPPAAESPSENGALYLVCTAGSTEIAFPWVWVRGARFREGRWEAFRIADRTGEREVRVGEVIGLMTVAELEARRRETSLERLSRPDQVPDELGVTADGETQPEIERAGSPQGIDAGDAFPDDEDQGATVDVPIAVLTDREAPPPRAEAGWNAPPAPESERAPAETEAPGGVPASPAVDESAPAPPAASAQDESQTALPDQVCIVSPSALARRFLMRHLCELGYEVLEARDLDDPLLPADLKGMAALFLDESLHEVWTAKPEPVRTARPVVLLTVDGELQVPAQASNSVPHAVLPRPFERSEVEHVVRWLRGLSGREAASENEGERRAEDDTWLFTDPFADSRAGDDPGR